MQRNSNVIRRGTQTEKLVSVGIDMGGTLWATNYMFWDKGKSSYHGYRDNEKGIKEAKLYDKVSELVHSGYRVCAFYEAGRYGFTPARILETLGAEVKVLPVNKLEIISCGKKVKTDKIDSKFLSGLHPEDEVPSVYVPSVEEEGRRGAERELERLKKSVKRLNSQLISLLEKSPVAGPSRHQDSPSWKKMIREWRKSGELDKLPRFDVLRMDNLVAELKMYEEHLRSWEGRLQAHEDERRKAARAKNQCLTSEVLAQYAGISKVISRHFDWVIGDFARFKNARSFTSYFGLTPTPWSSGTMNREQGISKAGNKNLRRLAIEMAWLWVRWQPNCELVKKWTPRLKMRGRSRKTAITALARQLLVALWRRVVHGEEIKGAAINAPLPVN
jgi:transposase